MKNMYFLTEDKADKYFTERGDILKNGVFKLDDKVIKKIDVEKSQSVLYGVKFSYDKLLQFKDINVQGFSFAKGIIYTGLHNVYGTISEYANGNNLEEKSLSCYKIEDVINAIDIIKDSIKKISELNIGVNDIRNSNIIFDSKNMTLIDTTEYYFVYGDSKLYESNIVAIMETIFNDLFFSFYKNGTCDLYNVYNLLDICKTNLDYFKRKEFLMNPVETLFMIKKYLEELLEMKLNTFGDCHEYIPDIIRGKTKTKRR